MTPKIIPSTKMPNRQIDFENFREKYSRLVYQNYSYRIDKELIRIDFEFVLEPDAGFNLKAIMFKPQLELPIPETKKDGNLNKEQLDNLVFHMGMVELISYWKAACPKEILIKPFRLNQKQIQFFKKLYWHGLGEFFYVNEIEIDFQNFVQLSSESQKELSSFTTPTEEKILIPIGGGKDSAVSLEILKKSELGQYPFIINARKAQTDTIEQAAISGNHWFLAKRNIDAELLKLNEQGFLNGHTPFSAMLAFTSLLQAYLADIKYIALSNESSANEASVAGTHVNHQYSKSFAFESDFRAYYKKYITTDIEYFSFLRPVSEIQIAKLFSRFENHHFSFRSCNAGSKTDSWCCNCPKCLFTYIMLAPFLPEKKLIEMLGENLLNKKSLEYTLKELCGLTDEKPFECVGTVEEVNLALFQAFEYQNYTISEANQKNVVKSSQMVFDEAVNSWNEEHFVPEFLEKILRESMNL